MTHPLIEQLRFTRSEWRRGLEAVAPTDAERRFEPMNSIAWMVGHLAWQEQLYWLQHGQGITLSPEAERCGSGQPAYNPDAEAMWAAWHQITTAADPYLEALTTEALLTHQIVNGKEIGETIGTRLHRMIYHYWFHLGEAQAVRQLLGHSDLPGFVGRIGPESIYQPDSV